MNSSKQKKVNIGAGMTYIPGFINVDISEKAQVTLDLSKDKLPMKDNSVDIVFSYHTLEHIPDYLHVLSEIHRVLKHGGRFLLGTPYVTLTEYHLVNPYHLHNFNEYSFDFFDNSKMKGLAEENNTILFKKIFHRYHYIGAFRIMPTFLKTWCRRHLMNVVRKIDFGLIAIKDSNQSLDVHGIQDLISEFDECLNSRRAY
jgi:SAM-dependent methyltransferase